MKTHPIIFSGPMVRALLHGCKTQTRRIAKYPSRYAQIEFLGGGGKDSPDWNDPQCWGYADEDGIYYTLTGNPGDDICPCLYGKPGDLLWVRESAYFRPNAVAYAADNVPLRRGERVEGWGRIKPSIHMPRWASRLTLELTDVRVERLQDISEDDALAEGLRQWEHRNDFAYGFDGGAPHGYGSPRGAFHALWESIHGEGAWDENPWLWVLIFRVHHCNVDDLIKQKTA